MTKLTFTNSLAKIEQEALVEVKHRLVLETPLSKEELDTVCSKVMKFVVDVAKKQNKVEFSFQDLNEWGCKVLPCKQDYLGELQRYVRKYGTDNLIILSGSFQDLSKPIIYMRRNLTALYFYVPTRHDLDTLKEIELSEQHPWILDVKPRLQEELLIYQAENIIDKLVRFVEETAC